MSNQKSLQQALNTNLSPDKMGDYTPNELAEYLVKNGVVDNAADMNRIVIEGIQKALNDDDEFPIKYYAKDEEMPEKSREIDPGVCLTDQYIADNLNP